MSVSASIVTTSRETLVFRDGKPFGMAGALTGGRMAWPMPSTIVGMIRSRVGVARSTADADYFARGNTEEQVNRREANIRALHQISVRSLPMRRDVLAPDPLLEPPRDWEFLFPTPADAAIFPVAEQDRKLKVRRFTCEPLAADDEGCSDLSGPGRLWGNWLLPLPPCPDKPVDIRPLFWREKAFHAWLAEKITGDEYNLSDLGIARLALDTRIHTAIDSATGTVVDGALFDSPGIRFGVPAARGEGKPATELGLAVFLDGLSEPDDVSGAVHFGGERRIAHNDRFEKSFPPPPDELVEAWGTQRFLRLVLTAPGSFDDNWVPSWLLPENTPLPANPDGGRLLQRLRSSTQGRKTETPWRDVPGTRFRVRLRSAFVPGWLPVSGWDYDTHSPKPMRKLVPAGAVYVVEVEHPRHAPAIAEALWGRSICDKPKDGRDGESQEARDGFGITVVGCANELCQAALH